MALADYILCERCGTKAIYDCGISDAWDDYPELRCTVYCAACSAALTAERDAALDRMRGLEQAVDRRTAACESLAADVRSLVEFVETIDFEDQTGTLARSQGLWPIVERLRESEAGQ